MGFGRKPKIVFEYDNMQSHNGTFFYFNDGEETGLRHFKKISVQGNKLLVNGSDNGWSEDGRLQWIFDLDKYDVEFK